MRILEAIFGAAAAVAVAFREDFVGQPRLAPGARRRARGVAPVSADPTAGSLQLAQAQSGSGTGAREQGNSGQRDSGATVGVRSAVSDESVIVKRKKAKRGRAGKSGGASGGASSGGRESPSGRQ
jgi:hypothetical protein